MNAKQSEVFTLWTIKTSSPLTSTSRSQHPSIVHINKSESPPKTNVHATWKGLEKMYFSDWSRRIKRDIKSCAPRREREIVELFVIELSVAQSMTSIETMFVPTSKETIKGIRSN